MTAKRRHRRGGAAIAVAAAAIAAGLVGGCDSSASWSHAGYSAACFPSGSSIAASLIAIHEAGLDAQNNPGQTAESIATINENLAQIGDKTDNANVNKAIDDLDTAIANYNRSILDGNTDPDTTAINNAVNELANACTS
jgi:hypothetical protein